MKTIYLPLFVTILFSCNFKEKSISKTEKTKVEKILKAENDLSASDSEITRDSIFFESKREKNKVLTLEFAIVKNTNLTFDTSNSIIANKPCVISIMPHRKIIEKYQKNLNEDGWNTILDDNLYYESIFLDSLINRKIPHIYFYRDKRFIIFKNNNGTKIILDQKKFLSAWGYILFNGKDIPTFWNELEISPILDKIFK